MQLSPAVLIRCTKDGARKKGAQDKMDLEKNGPRKKGPRKKGAYSFWKREKKGPTFFIFDKTTLVT